MNPDRQSVPVSKAAVDAPSVKRFDSPERVLVFDKGRLELITVGGQLIGKGSYAPGWRWSHVAAAVPQTGNRPNEYLGVLLSGRAKLSTGQGETDLTAGGFFYISSEHDVWVVGYRPCEILYLAGVDALVARLRSGVRE